MIYDNVESGLAELLFTVREEPVYVIAETGSNQLIPHKKALINDNTSEVLSVVSDRYEVLENRTALEIVESCCIKAFPNSKLENWRVFSIEAPLTLGHCRVDFSYKGDFVDSEWSLGKNKNDKYVPFVRMCNSYNTTFAFTIRFGLIRWACTNGLVDWDSSITIKAAHNTVALEKAIAAQVNEDIFKLILDNFRKRIEPLYEVRIREHQFKLIMLEALKINMPKGMLPPREKAWHLFMDYLSEVIKKYVAEIGENGYALFNAITDIATHPDRPKFEYKFIRRERDALQRLAGTWLDDFSKLIPQQQSLEKYLSNPSKENIRPLIQVKS